MFSMTMLTTLDTEKADFNAVQEKLEGVAAELGVQITIQREDVFSSCTRFSSRIGSYCLRTRA